MPLSGIWVRFIAIPKENKGISTDAATHFFWLCMHSSSAIPSLFLITFKGVRSEFLKTLDPEPLIYSASIFLWRSALLGVLKRHEFSDEILPDACHTTPHQQKCRTTANLLSMLSCVFADNDARVLAC